MALLEVGCIWGLMLQRALEKYDVNASASAGLPVLVHGRGR
jgi:cyclopropane fatty-acyl-phospholipid synthase-like methyltransferase